MQSSITEKQLETLLDVISQGESVLKACDAAEVKAPTFYRLMDSDESVAVRYARAKDVGLRILSEKLLAVADNQSIDSNSRRLMVDTRKWLLSKLAPKQWGDRSELSVTMRDTEQLSTDELTALIRQHLPTSKDSPQT
jgi:ABC-type uncharacterized transport system auxiliary subunit